MTDSASHIRSALGCGARRTRITWRPFTGWETRRKFASWRWEALRTTFWLVPTVLVVVAGCSSSPRFEIDWAAYYGHLTLPFWMRTGSADAGREVLIAIAAAVITVVGVVFSITILALTLASQQFGPRMMRNFVRDVGNQVTLGVFVATFVYSVLALGSITIGGHAASSSRTSRSPSPRPCCSWTSPCSSTSSTTSPSRSSCPRSSRASPAT